ncbi:hypothetical protein MT349_19040 [Rathayibacter caricis]|uniref:hypothetical protein n=1 Tax=Rathayibacter caricis TaxID=110936 RepID=UPI001FB43C25|nr:hypothetical protein [Rathayibacter caricis]MCJ1697884.1 hypothetical protein [Rathayibacter caricis]
MSSRATAGAVLGIASVLALSGCTTASTPVDAADPNAPASTGTTSAPPVVGAPTSTAEVPAADPDDESVPHDHDVHTDHSAEADTTALATRATSLYCRPGLDYDTWINELYPVLSQQAAVAYETVDPANVPCTSVTGAASVRDGDGAFTMRILVPTDAGEYSVYVHRTVETGPWAVEQITPLASE